MFTNFPIILIQVPLSCNGAAIKTSIESFILADFAAPNFSRPILFFIGALLFIVFLAEDALESG